MYMKNSVDITSLQKHREEFHLELKNSFEVLQLILEEEQDVTIVKKKLTNTSQEISKMIIGEE